MTIEEDLLQIYTELVTMVHELPNNADLGLKVRNYITEIERIDRLTYPCGRFRNLPENYWEDILNKLMVELK